MTKYIKKYWILVLIASIFIIIEVSADLYQPRLMANIIDNGVLGVNNGGIPDISIIKKTGIYMISIAALGCICGVLGVIFTVIFSQRYGNDLRKDCFKKIMNFSFEQTDKYTTGSLITRMTNDVVQVQNMLSLFVMNGIRFGTLFLAGSFAIFSLNINFIKVVIPALPIIIIQLLLVIFNVSPIFSKIQQLQQKLDALNSSLQENISGIRLVKAFVQEENEFKKFFKKNSEYAQTQLKVLILLACIIPIVSIIISVAMVAVIYIGGMQVQNSHMAPGDVIAGVTYIYLILLGIIVITMTFPTFARGLASSSRLVDILNIIPVIGDGEGVKISTRKGCIDFNNVSFKYPGQKSYILKNINFHVDEGETVAVIGPTGCGKTTLINLITRFYDATEGQVKVNDYNVKSYKLNDLRNKISLVLQQSELFTNTIKKNIFMGDSQAGVKDIEMASEIAQAKEFIMNQPFGYETEVTDDGMNLSGGQRQRVALARALIKRPQILVLDDATSALDFKTEKDFYTDLDKNYPDMTKIVVSQRILTVKNADKILVMDNGEIISSGRHEELLSSCTVYREIYNSQIQEEE